VETRRRRLIVNADDLGMSTGINQGIIEAHEHGVVRSASLMVRWPLAEEAGAYASRQHQLSVGLHLDLGEWALQHGEWVELYRVLPLDDPRAVRTEAGRQLERFREMVGRDPTHLDSHQHVHRNEPVREAMVGMARALGVPLRECTPGINYCGDFYGQNAQQKHMPGALTVASLLAVVRALPAGTTELGCHPGYSHELDNPYGAERDEELRVLTDPKLPALLEAEEIELCSFAEFAGEVP